MQTAGPGTTTTMRRCEGRPLVGGRAQGPLLCSDTALSFWGGVDPVTGRVIDHHHPLRGRGLAGHVLALPGSRGSCTGSGVLLELVANGHAPAAILVSEPEEILTLGALVAQEIGERAVPVLQVDRAVFARLPDHRFARLEGRHLGLGTGEADLGEWPDPPAEEAGDVLAAIRLEPVDRALLSGRHGRAAQAAMRLLLRWAAIQGAPSFMDVTQVHIDGCIYTGPAGLRFAAMLVAQGGRVRVPTTLNAISVDRRRWQALGVPASLGEPASALADAYVALGAAPTFTCAPYLLDTAPVLGEQVGWAESNAVVYANSMLGARTVKYPDFLDACVALTGRAPLAGCHRDEGRRATLALDVEMPAGADDAVWPLLGYCCGRRAGHEIPLVRGLAGSGAGPDQMKAFGAAFATVSAAPMFHMDGVTPEAAAQAAPARAETVGLAELRAAWTALNSADTATVELVSLGNPHLSGTEFAQLAALMRGRRRAPEVAVVVTCGRDVHAAACRAGHVAVLEAFGATVLTDTCWCMLGEPVVPRHVRTLITNSGKYAHYAPGLVGRGVRFGSLAACVDAACDGRAPNGPPDWLRAAGPEPS